MLDQVLVVEMFAVKLKGREANFAWLSMISKYCSPNVKTESLSLQQATVFCIAKRPVCHH
jgi:hypothetical protein